jgi:hypothetical protein
MSFKIIERSQHGHNLLVIRQLAPQDSLVLM